MIREYTDRRGDFIIFDSKECNQVNVVTNTEKYTFRGLHYQTDPPQECGWTYQWKTMKY